MSNVGAGRADGGAPTGGRVARGGRDCNSLRTEAGATDSHTGEIQPGVRVAGAGAEAEMYERSDEELESIIWPDGPQISGVEET